ncbi:TPA: head decoration protein [Pseudomonas aeruginosa]|uniref:head decoration protein n=1 Tax=Pseudomonas aeruginosa TaxID=287 RepID=UPI0029425EAD|nr:head decoration protein [Pseudomonas aeruginosa]WOJ10977.1 head decoration protein [Pseudomonas aeruginosa]HBO8861022.1 head decoration protein [Pseudomonas aeruginosa]HCK4321398.1 head decoration protein [Pseudomonas aeruginosa]HCK5623222.1 head decoration protein [Pseudomonas aeruginosa]HCL4420247.1 head decoration protein [Pseudomonas aeruginosa]
MYEVQRNTYVPDQLAAGDFPIATGSGVIAAGQVLKRGAVLGRVTASKEYKLSVAAADDGSQAPSAVLLEAVDTSAGAKVAPLQLTGDVRFGALTVGEGHGRDSLADALRPFCLFVR